MKHEKEPDISEENNVDLVPAFGRSLFGCWSESIADTIDYGFDQLAAHIFQQDLSAYLPAVQGLPVIQYFVTTGKFIATIRERNFLKKTQKFFATLRNGKVKSSEIERRTLAIQNNEGWIYQELELLVSTIERFDRTEKSKILAELYKAYLNGEIRRIEFDDFCSVTERLFLMDIVQIRANYEEVQQQEEIERQRKAHQEPEVYVLQSTRYLEITGRLLALGLMRISAKVGNSLQADCDILEYTISEKGKKYAEILSRIDFLGISQEIFMEKEGTECPTLM